LKAKYVYDLFTNPPAEDITTSKMNSVLDYKNKKLVGDELTSPFKNITPKTILDYKNDDHLRYVTYLTRRHTNSKEKFVLKLNKNGSLCIHTTLPRILINMYIFRVLDEYNVSQKDRHLFIFNMSYTKGKPKEYMSRCLEVLNKYPIERPDIFLYSLLSDIKHQFEKIAVVINGVISLEHSLYSYNKAYRENPEFKKALDNPVFNPDDSPYEQDDKLNNVKDMIRRLNISPMSDLLRMGVKVNIEQLKAFISYGPVPNPLNTDQCMDSIQGGYLNGFKRRQDLFAGDLMARIATIKGKEEVKTPGVVTKRLLVAVLPQKLNKADTRAYVEDCGNDDHFKSIHITSKEDLLFYKYKYYYDDKGKELGHIHPDRTDLIGKSVNIRSLMNCRAPDTVCIKCFGHNYKFLLDNEVQKRNFGIFTVERVAKDFQDIISIKHHLSAFFAPIHVTYGKDIVNMSLDVFLKEYPYIKEMKWNRLIIDKRYKIKFVNYDVTDYDRFKQKMKKDKLAFSRHDISQYGILYINDIPLETSSTLKRINEYTYEISIPNTSKITEATNLMTALNKHSVKNKGDFTYEALRNKTVPEQLWVVYEYLKEKIHLPHFIYYETLIHALVKDKADPSSKITASTKDIFFTHTDHVISRPQWNRNLADGLLHGYINAALMIPNPMNEPTETDLLYRRIKDRENVSANIYEKFNDIIDAAQIENDNEIV